MASGISGEIFNVGSTERVSIVELAERVVAATGSDSELTFTPYDSVYGQGIEDMLHREPSIEKVTATIGWQPTRSLDAILADVIDHVRHAPALEGSLD
jgi:UDP-glucose 4-epimerase